MASSNSTLMNGGENQSPAILKTKVSGTHEGAVCTRDQLQFEKRCPMQELPPGIWNPGDLHRRDGSVIRARIN